MAASKTTAARARWTIGTSPHGRACALVALMLRWGAYSKPEAIVCLHMHG